MSAATTLILFDIDGTLVLTGGAGGRAMARAFEDRFGIPGAFDGTLMSGRTDTWILSDALARHGIRHDDPRLSGYRDTYFHHLAEELAAPPPGKAFGVMPGVRELLDVLAGNRSVFLALLTGNYEHSAEMKLSHFDLWKYFRCGAFGDHTIDRNGLLATAIARVAECGGPQFAPDAAIVIGDTPLDIEVAVAGGARSIGVATGSYASAVLRAARADIVFENLSDTAAVLNALNLAV